MQKLANELIKLGAKYGTIDVENVLVSRKTLHDTFLDEEFILIKDKVFKKVLDSIKNSITFTTDFWTDSYKQNSYISLTAHLIDDDVNLNHFLITCELMEEKKTGENIKITIFKILKDFLKMSSTEFETWKNSENFVFVTDNGSNLVNALKQFVRVSCAGHNLNLVIDNWVKSMEANDPVIKLINYCKDITMFFKRSGLNTKLSNSLKQSVPTRWNSILYMLKSVNQTRYEIEELLMDRPEIDRFLVIDFDLLNDVIEVLEPFDQATKDLSYENTPTFHKVLPWFKKLQTHLIENADDDRIIRNIKYCLRNNLCNKYTIKPVHKLASFLDPKMKKFTNLLNIEEREIVYGEIKNIMKQYKVTVPEIIHTDPNSSIKREKILLQDFFDEPSEENIDSADSEFIKYIQYSNFKIDQNILEFWKDKKEVFPRLFEMAKFYLAIPATSTPSERIFSMSGHTLQKRRSQLSGNSIKKLLFVKYNS